MKKYAQICAQIFCEVFSKVSASSDIFLIFFLISKVLFLYNQLFSSSKESISGLFCFKKYIYLFICTFKKTYRNPLTAKGGGQDLSVKNVFSTKLGYSPFHIFQPCYTGLRKELSK